ncbi:DUF2971 domain-containing protein [Agrobacterium sp. 16-2014-1-2a]
MRLFYYTSLNYGLAAIRDRRLKISEYSQLNDTSELSLYVEGPTNRKHQRRQIERLDREGGIICMSAVYNSPLMWGQYADKHKGVALIFDVDPQIWNPIGYTETRPNLEMFGKARYRDLSERDLRAVAMMKSTEWSYEIERRAQIPFDVATKENGLYFASFDTASVNLYGILFGIRTQVSAEELDAVNHLKSGFMKQSDSNYKIILDTALTMRNQNHVTFYDLDKDVYEDLGDDETYAGRP